MKDRKEKNQVNTIAPAWIEPVIDGQGNLVKYRINERELADQVLQDQQIEAFTDKNMEEVRCWDEQKWTLLTDEELKRIVASYFVDDRFKKLETYAIIKNVAGLVKAHMHESLMSETIAADKANISPFKWYDFSFDPVDADKPLKPKKAENYLTYARSYDPVIPDKLSFEKKDFFLTEKWLLQSLGEDAQALELLETLIGSCFYNSYSFLNFYLFIVGEGEDGKSVFAQYLRRLIGENQSTGLALEDLIQNRFALSELNGKSVNISPDEQGLVLSKSKFDLLKKLTGNDTITVDVKNRSQVTFKNHAKLIFICNQLPEVKATLQRAEKRRFIILKWHRIENFEKLFSIQKINKEIPSFAGKCLKRFTLFLLDRMSGESQEQALPDCQQVKDNLKQFQIDTDPVSEFLAVATESNLEDPQSKGWITNSDELYRTFIRWAEDSKHSKMASMTQNVFNRRIKNLGYVKKRKRDLNGRSYVWQGINLLPEINWKQDLDLENIEDLEF